MVKQLLILSCIILSPEKRVRNYGNSQKSGLERWCVTPELLFASTMQWLVQQSCLPNGKEWGSMPKSPSSLSALKQWHENKDCFKKLMRPSQQLGLMRKLWDWISLVYTNICNQTHSGTIKRPIKEKSDPIRSCFQFCCCCLWSTKFT
jgi:hypothetical protein